MKHRIVLLLLVSSLLFFPILYGSLFSDSVYGQESVTDWWPMYRHDLSYTGVSTSIAPITNETLWIYSTKHQIISSPVIFEDVLYIGSYDQNIYALNSTTGQSIWKYETNGTIFSTPAIENGKIFVSASDGVLYALNASTGQKLWSVEFWGLGHSSPVVSNGKIFIGSGFDKKLCALDSNNGLELWNFTTGGSIISSPAISNGIVYVGSTDKKIYAVNALDGTLLWSFTTCAEVNSSPCIAEGKMFIGSEDGNLYTLDARNGDLIWSFETYPHGNSNSITSSPAFSEGIVFFGARHGFGNDWPWTFYALDASTGGPIWNYTRGGYGFSSPAVADGKVFIMDYGGGIHALNAMTGDPIWYYNTEGSASSSSPAVADGRVYVGSGNGKIYCFAPMLYFNIQVDPLFYDIRGELLSTPPTSWTISYPSGAEVMMNNSNTFLGPMGKCSLHGFLWNGNEVHSNTTVSTFLASNMTWKPEITLILPTNLTSTVSSSLSNVGLEINIQGRLTCNEKAVSNTPILLSYSVTEGKTWNEIMLIRTDSNGFYSTTWTPSATGNYILRANWVGNSTYPEAAKITNMDIIAFNEQAVFSVASNSTVSALAFNSTSKELRFTLSGVTGTTGYVDVCISKTLIDTIYDVHIYLNESELEYDAISLDDSWLFHFIYTHSAHEVVISLTGVSAPLELPINDLLPILLVLSVIALSVILIYFSRRKR